MINDNNNKSDYNRPFTDLLKLLPEPYQSDVNISLFSNLFNRFLTKQETEQVAGFIGRGNPNAIVSRQIRENDVHRQAFQLQPILYNKIGSIEHMASWVDIQTELSRLGIQIVNQSQWGAVQQFNWAPPVDINKIINFQDYFWVDPNDTNPQYITIRSRCAVATSLFTFWTQLITQYGSLFPVIDILETDDIASLPSFSIDNIDFTGGNVFVTGDITATLMNGDFFNIASTVSNNGTYEIVAAPTYDGISNTTTLPVLGLVANESVGSVFQRRFDKIVFGPNATTPTGDYASLFEEGFVFFMRNGANPSLNNRFIRVLGSVADVSNSRTTVTIELMVTDNTFTSAEGSLIEQEGIFNDEQRCQCDAGLLGWDETHWDDNPNSPLWGDLENAVGAPIPDGISDQQNLIDRISNPGPPGPPGIQNELWFDTVGDALFQYDTIIGWKLIWNSFSLVIAANTGLSLWDASPDCDTGVRIEATDQWITQNFWRHRNDITNFSGTVRATQPIIEYDWDLELNEWSITEYNWSYRGEASVVFIETQVKPPIIELEEIIWWELDSSDVTNMSIILDSRYGDQTDSFSPNRSFAIGNNVFYDVAFSEYKSTPNTHPLRTFVTFTTPVVGSTGSFSPVPSPNSLPISPVETSQGDVFSGYGVHWLFRGSEQVAPIPHQVVNPDVMIADDATVSLSLSGDANHRTSLFAQSFEILSPTKTVFDLLNDIPTVDTRSLRRKSLFGFDDIRVYVTDVLNGNSVRQFGTYDEIGEASIAIVGIDTLNDEFILAPNLPAVAAFFTPGDTIRLDNNTSVGIIDYTVISFNSTTKRLRVSIPLVGISVDGDITNLTTPVTTINHPTVTFTNTDNITVYLVGISFLVPVAGGQTVLIEVGEAAINDLGMQYKPVRIIEDQQQFSIQGNMVVSLVQHRKIEQIKTLINQYPLFDVFNTAGEPNQSISSIFGYKTSPTSPINQTGLRIVHDTVNNIYSFDQFLLSEDNGELFAYRDYSNRQADFWYSSETGILSFWHGTEWDDRTMMSEHYRRAIVSGIEPGLRERQIDGFYWYNTTSNILFIRDAGAGVWNVVADVDRTTTDINLQTIWKAGTNSEVYVPEMVDWTRRSLPEYNIEMADFIGGRIIELQNENISLSLVDATTTAASEWFTSQQNALSPTGIWIGAWEIPDPLYHNNLHENRKCLTSRDLLTHFETIIEAQPPIPGFNGLASSRFNLIPFNEVNYGLGGTIHEYNDGFDTFLSSTFVNNVTPRSLIEFAHDQYEALLNSIQEIYRANAIVLLTNIEPNNILDISSFVANQVITLYELNDQNALVYGDTTTFTDVDGVNDLGVRNWIATLPYVALVNRQLPLRTISSQLGINEVVHHDGHRTEYNLSTATIDIISQLITSAPDVRGPSSTMGEISLNLPPNTIIDFSTSFGTSISNREGVYWYNTSLVSSNVLYRYVVAESGINEPSSTLVDGTLWMDITPGAEVLRVKNTDFQGIITWDIVNGLVLGDGRLHNGSNPLDVTTATISAWQVVDLDVLLGDTIFELETRLYNNVPTTPELAFDFDNTKQQNMVDYQNYSEEAFLEHVSQLNIPTPFLNSTFDATDAFTWNYKRSAGGGGLNILEADGLTNSFLVAGDRLFFFDPCADSGTCFPGGTEITFYIKNSDVNNGTFVTLSSTLGNFTAFYNPGDDTTRVFVQNDVLTSTSGIIHSSILPSQITPLTPNNLNDGSESGGDWRDLYTNIYNTPYPNLEPWRLQGYSEKPSWWDAEYLNDDITQYGNRLWKYNHGFDITAISNNDNDAIDGTHGSFSIAGNFNTTFTSGHVFSIDSSASNNGPYVLGERDVITAVNPGGAGTASITIDDTLNFASAIYVPNMVFSVIQTPIVPVLNNVITNTYTIQSINKLGPVFTISIQEEVIPGAITAGISAINGALYNTAINSTLLKIAGLPTSTVVDGRLLKSDNFGLGMWENIRRGVIPPNQEYPNGAIGITGVPQLDSLSGISVPDLPTFNYFSVNIHNNILTDGSVVIQPDEVIPPFWNHTVPLSTIPNSIDLTIRTLFFDFSTDIVSPNLNYVFGDAGPVEWEWATSSQFLYDRLTIAYRIDPVRYVSSTFGGRFNIIGELQVDRNTRNTPSHTRTDFHGDVVNNIPFVSNGLNQWYVNFNRQSGFDANFSDFSELWKGWTAPLTYQFASFVDSPSLSIAHRLVPISEFDFNLSSKRAPGVNDFWLDAFNVSILNMPLDILRFDNQFDWRFELRTNINISRTIQYYDVHNYQFYANPATDECILYTWEIETLSTFDRTFTVVGDQTYVFTPARQFDITASTGNNSTYNVTGSMYDSAANTTIITVSDIIPSAVSDGLITADYRNLPWQSGQPVYLTTAEVLPIPLLGDTINGSTRYFIIRISDNTFQIANTPQDATTSTPIDIASSGVRDHFVGELISNFVADSGTITSTNWKLYAVDTTNILEFRTPFEVQGVQNIVNIIQGYDRFSSDMGWIINEDNTLTDPDSGRIISWQLEVERFISYAFAQRNVRAQRTDTYPVLFDTVTDIWTFIDNNQTFITGEPLVLLSSNGVFPLPLSARIQYYMIRDSLQTFRLAETKNDAIAGISIDLLATPGVGDIMLAIPSQYQTVVPSFEMNPFRNSAFLNTPTGIVSNIITGPADDIRTSQSIFDQEGNRIGVDNLRVYRQDLQTKIQVVDSEVNVTPQLFVSPEYRLLNLGGLHIFTDAYEHVVLFNNNTTDGVLLYDPFIGLNVTKYELLFNRQPNFTQRPNVGGYAIETFFNQGTNLTENLEAGVENLRFAYDTYTNLESNQMTQFSRRALGYNGSEDFLRNLNLSDKSQFLFWRGQIQYKGSRTAITAFVNSRRFVDANIDEFWAIKIGEFGSVSELEYPELFITTTDARSNELRLEFIDNSALPSSVEESFTPIQLSNEERWFEQPDQSAALNNNGSILYFDMKIVNRFPTITVSPPTTPLLFLGIPGQFVKHLLDVDSVEVTQVNPVAPFNTIVFTEGVEYEVINNNFIELNAEIFIGGTITIWGLRVNNDAQSPARIIDRESQTQLGPIQFWDPARGIHYSNAIHNVDIQNDVDPAQYTTTFQGIVDQTLWDADFTGTTWLNTENLDYVPYFSEQMIPNTTERLRNWGQLADWSSIRLFEWVESDVPPTEWDVIAAQEENDNSITESIRKSGVARFILLEFIGGSFVPAVNKVVEQYATEALQLPIILPTFYDFDAIPFTDFMPNLLGDIIVDVYVNGKIFASDITLSPSAPGFGSFIFSFDDLKINDVVRFIQPPPTDQAIIDANIIAGTMQQVYEFVQISSFDALEIPRTTYYFWVETKNTRPDGRNRTMTSAEAAVQLVTIPAPHMFFQNPQTPITAPTSSVNTVFQRSELFSVTVLPVDQSQTLALPVAPTTDILVEVNGVDLPTTGFSILTVGPTTTVTIINPLPGGGNLMIGDEIKITYFATITESIILPNRFSQAVIRGLQGVVNADRRYTVRFTRNFTLRDSLDVENLNIAPVELKTLHEEWRLFRQEQQNNIERDQWDKITESIVGFLLVNPLIRVPSIDRELYDARFNTDTQYGLEEGQVFVNGELALNSILGYLNDPEIDFTPIDIDSFFANNNFDTPDAIIAAMNTIYNTFIFTDVNRMYFSVLHDAFTTKERYPGLFKTSMISVHGIRPFATNGVFDD